MNEEVIPTAGDIMKRLQMVIAKHRNGKRPPFATVISPKEFDKLMKEQRILKQKYIQS